MSIYTEWENLIGNQTEDSFPDFWEEYSAAETKLYSNLLDKPEENLSGTIAKLSEETSIDQKLVTGFLDGINSSLETPIDMENIELETPFTLEVNYETLYFNMLEAGAEYLFTLPQWQTILGEDKIKEITRAHKASKTVVKEDKVGRNDPCPCGSGKKYKKCCGK